MAQPAFVYDAIRTCEDTHREMEQQVRRQEVAEIEKLKERRRG